MSLSDDDRIRFERQIKLPEAGEAGQARLRLAGALVVGAGGLGSAVLLYLAAAGVGRIGIVDSDRVEPGNLHRQVIHGMSSLGEWKTESARRRLLENNPATNVQTFAERFTDATAEALSLAYDIVVDASDNLETRRSINRVCVRLGKPMVYGSAVRWEGQVGVFDARYGACYECAFHAADAAKITPPAAAGVMGPVPGIIGTLEALEAVKILLGAGSPMYGRLLVFDGLSGVVEEIRIPRKADCPVCRPGRNSTESR
jgi:sulfur-carrier protein adenylyltransferase/sulfurtransferase